MCFEEYFILSCMSKRPHACLHDPLSPDPAATASDPAATAAAAAALPVVTQNKQQKRETQWLKAPNRAQGGRPRPRIGADFQVAALPEPSAEYRIGSNSDNCINVIPVDNAPVREETSISGKD